MDRHAGLDLAVRIIGEDLSGPATTSAKKGVGGVGEEVSKYAQLTKLADEQHKKLQDTIMRGSPEMGEQWRRLVGVQINMRREIEATTAAGKQASAEQIANLARVERQTDEATAQIRQMTAEMRKRGVEVQSEIGTATSLSGVVQQVGVRYGQVGVAVSQLAGNLFIAAAVTKTLQVAGKNYVDMMLGPGGLDAVIAKVKELNKQSTGNREKGRQTFWDFMVQGAGAFDETEWWKEGVGTAAASVRNAQDRMARERREAMNVMDWGVQFGPTSWGDERLKALDRERKAAEAIEKATGEAKQHFVDIKGLGAIASWAGPNGYVTAGVSAINQNTLDSARWSYRNRVFSDLDSQNDAFSTRPAKISGEARDRIEAAIKENNEEFANSLDKWRDSFGDLRSTFGDIAMDFAETGGKNFGEIAAGIISRKAAQGLAGGLESLFTPQAVTDDKGTVIGYKLPWSSTTYDSDEKAREGGAKRANTYDNVMTIGAAGLAGYGAGYSGTPGARTGATISGALGGAAMGAEWGSVGGVPGAVIGAVVGALAATLGGGIGAVQRQSQYKFVDPNIVGGRWSGYTNEDVNAGERAQIIADVQGRYDWSRNSIVRIFQSLGMQPGAGTFGDINGQVQPEGSANMLKHLDAWTKNILPDLVFTTGQVGEGGVRAANARAQVKSGFMDLGLTSNQFEGFVGRADSLAPDEMFRTLSSLAEVLKGFKENVSFFDASNASGMNTSWFQGLTGVGKERDKSFAESMRDDFSEILDLAGYLDDLVGADQVEAARDISGLMTAAREKEKAAMLEILRVQDSIKARIDNVMDRYTLMGMVDANGEADRERQAQFLKGRADDALNAILGAKDAAGVERGMDDFLGFIDQVVNLGYQIGPETGELWRKWAIDQISTAQGASNARLDQLGVEVQAENEKFIEQFKPFFDAFKESLGSATTPLDDFKDGVDRIKPVLDPFIGAMGLAGTSLSTLTTNVTDLQTAVAGLTAYLNSVSGGSGAEGFAPSTFAGQAALARGAA